LPAEPQITAEPVPPRSAAPPPGSRSGAPAARAVPPASPTSAAHAAPAVTPAAAAAPVASAPALDLNALEQRLRDTRAIGVFTKLSLKNQVDDLLTQFKAFYGGQSRFTLVQLRQNFEVLLMKVVSVLQEGDPALATAVSASREAIWGVLKDPKKFAAI
jgi:3-oxoacyl-ACP reductase-like protein